MYLSIVEFRSLYSYMYRTIEPRVEYTSVANPADRSLINRSHYQATPECIYGSISTRVSVYMYGA